MSDERVSWTQAGDQQNPSTMASPGRNVPHVQVYLPASADRPAKPAPYFLAEDDVVRLIRLEGSVATFLLRGLLCLLEKPRQHPHVRL